MPESERARFRRKLREQLGFIERSAQGYDEGHEEEALRLATTMRVSFHDTAIEHVVAHASQDAIRCDDDGDAANKVSRLAMFPQRSA
jgi:hypothetical protein